MLEDELPLELPVGIQRRGGVGWKVLGSLVLLMEESETSKVCATLAANLYCNFFHAHLRVNPPQYELPTKK